MNVETAWNYPSITGTACAGNAAAKGNNNLGVSGSAPGATLGTLPVSGNSGLTQVSTTASTLLFRHSRTNTAASDLTASYEWSADLPAWHPSAATSGGTTVTIAAATITDTAAPANDLVEVTATISGTSGQRIFVRLKATQP